MHAYLTDVALLCLKELFVGTLLLGIFTTGPEIQVHM